jgi:arginyl-tRNA synthetase
VHRKAWEKICDISRKEFEAVYQRLDVKLEERGESFYNPFIPDVLKMLDDKGLTEISDGATCIFFPGQKDPLMVRKSDGGYGYASTDMAALWYRLNEEKADWVIYVTDVGQSNHFKNVFKVRSASFAGRCVDLVSREVPRGCSFSV